MGEIFAPLESFLAALHGLDETGLFLEIARQSLLHQLVGIAALHGGGLCQLRFQFPGDVHFHLVGSPSLRIHRTRRRGRRQHDCDLVAIDLSAGSGVMRVALGVGRAQLLIAVLHFHGQLAGNVGRALADDLADLAHGRKLFGELHVFAAVLPANAASGLLGDRLLPALTGAARLGTLRILTIVSGLRVLGIGLLPVSRLLSLFAGLALLLAAVLRAGLLLRSLGPRLLPHAIHQTGHGVAEFAEQPGVFTRIACGLLVVALSLFARLAG